MHVSIINTSELGEDYGSLRISETQLDSLEQFVRASFQVDERGQPLPIAGAGYGDHDAFYQAHGRYSFVRTCNAWTGGGLKQAGLPSGVWTPFPGAVIQHLKG